jgi:N6-L-threonylcarbamoyladenine synthase
MTDLKPARILAIETSCDETACAVIENGRELLASTVASQMEIHARYGGVFPEVASRQHVLAITPVIQQTLAQRISAWAMWTPSLSRAGRAWPARWWWASMPPKGWRSASGLPLVGVNHLEGHLYSAWVYKSGDTPKDEPQFPLMALLVSGGHTELNLMTGHLEYQRLGATQDDAAGEAFDKVARMLGLGYPGGPAIQRAAESGDPHRFNFPRAKLDAPWDFSFSGLKNGCAARSTRTGKKEQFAARCRPGGLFPGGGGRRAF